MRLYIILEMIIKKILSKTNQYYTAQAKVSNQPNTSFTVTTLKDLPAGKYLVLAQVSASVSATSIMIARLYSLSNTTMLLDGYSRSTMSSGGGCTCWGLMEATKDYGSIQLVTYGYYSGSCTYTGSILAIKLI